MLSFVIAEEYLRIETSYPFNEVTAVLLLNKPHYHHTSHSDEPLLYHQRGTTHIKGEPHRHTHHRGTTHIKGEPHRHTHHRGTTHVHQKVTTHIYIRRTTLEVLSCISSCHSELSPFCIFVMQSSHNRRLVPPDWSNDCGETIPECC